MGASDGAAPSLFHCKECLRSFSRAFDFKRHQERHRAKKSYSCPHCAREFSRADAVTRHLKRNTGICARNAGKDDSDAAGSHKSVSPVHSKPGPERVSEHVSEHEAVADHPGGPEHVPEHQQVSGHGLMSGQMQSEVMSEALAVDVQSGHYHNLPMASLATPAKGFNPTLTPGPTPLASMTSLAALENPPSLELKAHGAFHEHRPNLIGPPFEPMVLPAPSSDLHVALHGDLHDRAHAEERARHLQLINTLETRVKMVERRLYLCESRLAEVEGLRYDQPFH